jgi:Icc-related predicted phosphoesterase
VPKPFKVFYVTDIHGSEICWRKFLNAGTFYQADVVIVGGDITGKATVPTIRRRDQWDTTMFDQHVVLKTEAEVADIERKIRNRGYYPLAVRIGRTLALNPGSSYEEGVLQGALVTLDPKKAKIINYVLVNG